MLLSCDMQVHAPSPATRHAQLALSFLGAQVLVDSWVQSALLHSYFSWKLHFEGTTWASPKVQMWPASYSALAFLPSITNLFSGDTMLNHLFKVLLCLAAVQIMPGVLVDAE